jgi:hypothetical protein
MTDIKIGLLQWRINNSGHNQQLKICPDSGHQSVRIVRVVFGLRLGAVAVSFGYPSETATAPNSPKKNNLSEEDLICSQLQ